MGEIKRRRTPEGAVEGDFKPLHDYKTGTDATGKPLHVPEVASTFEHRNRQDQQNANRAMLPIQDVPLPAPDSANLIIDIPIEEQAASPIELLQGRDFLYTIDGTTTTYDSFGQHGRMVIDAFIRITLTDPEKLLEAAGQNSPNISSMLDAIKGSISILKSENNRRSPVTFHSVAFRGQNIQIYRLWSDLEDALSKSERKAVWGAHHSSSQYTNPDYQQAARMVAQVITRLRSRIQQSGLEI